MSNQNRRLNHSARVSGFVAVFVIFLGLTTMFLSAQAPETVEDSLLSITSPASGQSVGGQVQVWISVSSSITSRVNRLDYYIDNSLYSTQTSVSFSGSLDSARYPNGNHTITAKAYDSSNNLLASDSVSVVIQNLFCSIVRPT